MLIISFLVLGFFGTSRSAVAFHEIDCDHDNDCPQDTFCYLITNLCAPCNPDYCHRLNRENSGWRKCHKEMTDCGGCLNGFYEEILTDGKARDACLKIRADFQSASMEDIEHIDPGNHLMGYVALIGVSAFGVILLVSLVYTRLHRPFQYNLQMQISGVDSNRSQECASRNQNNHIIPSAPPPYSCSSSCPLLPSENTEEAGYSHGQVKLLSDCSPSSPSLVEPDITLARTIERHVRFEKEQLVEARPFLEPNYVESDEGTENSDTNEEECTGSTRNFENPSYEDDSTVPSDWTPHPRAETGHTNEISSSETTEESRTKRTNAETESENEPETKRLKNCENTAEEPRRYFQCLNHNNNNGNEDSDKLSNKLINHNNNNENEDSD